MLRSFDDGRLFATASGSGVPTVLALHGWARSARDFAAVLSPAAPGAEALDALAVDLPGFGASPPPPAAWGAVEYAAALDPVLDAMAPRIVVLGHSFGGRVAVQLASARPERVRALVLTGVPLLARPGRRARPAPAYRLVRRLHRLGLVSEERMEAARQRHGSADYRAAQGVMRDVLVRSVGESYGPQLDAISCPVRLVWGADDTDVPPAVAQAAVERLSEASLRIVPGVGHLTPTAIPDILRQEVVEALGAPPRPAPGAKGAPS